MAHRNRGPRQAGRKRPLPRVSAEGQWFGYGRQERDAVSGWLFPVRLMVPQRGGLVSYRVNDESLDFNQNW